jgi:hypothetical protein
MIPANIFQTWHTKLLQPKMFYSISFIKRQNPNFKYYLFDDNNCREFIKKHFDNEVLNAFDTLIPGAYKADLWRYCVLYIHGGIYLDIKYIPVNGYKFYNLLFKEHFVYDINNIDVYNALMVCKAGNPFLLDAIHTIVQNVKNKFYGSSPLSPTGPKMLSTIIKKHNIIIDLKHKVINNTNHKTISDKNKIILTTYNNHINERIKYSKTEHYSNLWEKKQIYKKI